MTRRPASLLAAAGACAGLFVVLLVLAYGSDAARRADATSLLGFVAVEPNGGSLPDRIGKLGDPMVVILLAAVLAGVAVLRGRPRVAALVVILIGVTSVSSQLLKALLAYPRYEGDFGRAQVAAEAFPSGHSTAAMAIALCLVLVTPARFRPLAAIVGAGFALGVVQRHRARVALPQRRGRRLPPRLGLGGLVLMARWPCSTSAPRRRRRTQAAATLEVGVERATGIGLAALVGAGGLAIALAAVVIVLSPGGLMGIARRTPGPGDRRPRGHARRRGAALGGRGAQPPSLTASHWRAESGVSCSGPYGRW